MKELPYFRMTVHEWQNGDIQHCNDSLKGVFMDVCFYYWANNCEMTLDRLQIHFKTKTKSIQKLIELQTIKEQNGIVSISFLDEQLSELNQNKTFFSNMGKLGQKVKKSKGGLNSENKGGLSTSLSYKDKDKDKNTDKKPRKHSFAKSPYSDKEYYKDKFKDWPIEKQRHYYLSMKEYSETKGVTYLDWGKVAMSWARRDEDKGEQPWVKESVMI